MAIGDMKNPVKITIMIPKSQRFKAWEYPVYMATRSMTALRLEVTLVTRVPVGPK